MTTFQPVKFKTNDPFQEEPISDTKDFTQEEFNLLTDLSSLTGFSIGSTELDKLYSKSKKLVNLIDDITVARTEKLQKAVIEAFNHLDERLKALEKPVTAWETDGTPIHESLNKDQIVSDL